MKEKEKCRVRIHNEFQNSKQTLLVKKHSPTTTPALTEIHPNADEELELLRQGEFLSIGLKPGELPKNCFIQWPKHCEGTISHLTLCPDSDIRVFRTKDGETYLGLFSCPDSWLLEIRQPSHDQDNLSNLDVNDNVKVGSDEPGIEV